MKLTTALLPQIRHVLVNGRWFTPSVIVLFAGLEMFGRQATSDMHDTVGAMVLILILLTIAIRHRVNPIGWVKRLGGLVWGFARFGDRFKVEVGPDLRGTPPIPRGFPSGFYYLCLALSVWAGGLAAVWYYQPQGWRPSVVLVTYTGYLALMSLLWGLLFTALLGGIYFPIMLLSRVSGRSRPGDPRMTRGQFLFLGGYLASTAAATYFLPLWPVVLFTGLVWGAAVVRCCIPKRGVEFGLLWRSVNSHRVRSITERHFVLMVASVAVLLINALIFSASGGAVFNHDPSVNTQPLTATLGIWLAWLTPGLMISAIGFLLLSRRNDPSRPGRPTLQISGVPTEFREMMMRIGNNRGWDVSFDSPEPDDVRTHLVHPRDSQATEFDPVWPLAICLDDLQDGAVFDRFARRHEIVMRRLLVRGTEHLLTEAKGASRPGGSGHWYAPHLWFIVGLTRDEVIGGDEEPSFLTEVIGEPYADVFPMSARRHLYRVLKSQQIDLIFIEDGVGHRKFTKVLRMLFEMYDKSGGRDRKAQDVHFRGMTKVKVMFHDFDIEEPFRPSDLYPEPRFAPLGRLRVMHVFRDRGDHEERVDPPFEFDRTPAPLAFR